MSAVLQNISDFQQAPDNIVPMPAQPPAPGSLASEAGAEDDGVYAKTLNELQRPLKNDGQELLRNRFLCKGGGLLLVGPTGIGKSSLSMQMMVSWALGRPLFGIEPARPITSLLIQAENDEGDLAEMRDGVFSGLNLGDADRELACSRIFVVQENSRTSDEFFKETVRPMLQEIKPDLLWIDPALAYLGGENNSQQAVGAFLRNQLNPLLTEFNCAAVVIHHTNKPYNGPDKRGPVDFAYLGGGSAEWANWSRAILTMQKTEAATVFELRAPKRGGRLGWKEADGSTVAYNRFIAHCKEPGTICWIDVEPDLVEGLGKGNGKSENDVLKHVPLGRPVAKNTLINTCSKNGLGMTKTRNLIDGLVADGILYELQRHRPSCHPEKYLARSPRPIDLDDEAILTMFLTAPFACELPQNNASERSSQLHGPLGPVKIACEDRERRAEVALLPVEGTNGREDQPPAPLACPPETRPDAPSINAFPPLPDTSNWPPPRPVPCPVPCPGPQTAEPISAFPPIPDASNSTADSRVPWLRPGSDPQVQESKAIIRITSPPPTQPDIEDRLITELHDKSQHPKIDLPQLLINLGQKLLEHEQADKWLTMPQVAECCRRYRLNWKHQTTKAVDLQRFGMEYFKSHTDIMGGGIKVEYRTEWNENKTRQLLFLQFRKLYGDGHCH